MEQVSGDLTVPVIQKLKVEIMKITQTLLDAVVNNDYEVYRRYCDPEMTAFEPEALGNLVDGLGFHRFHFENGMPPENSKSIRTTLINANVNLIGEDGAVIAYVRLTQFVDKGGELRTRKSEETRVWKKKNGRWLCSHIHRSGAPSTTYAAKL